MYDTLAQFKEALTFFINPTTSSKHALNNDEKQY
jgi:hypothetical protein